MEAPALRSLDFDKDFILYTFASDTSYAIVLTQNNDVGDEFPISFMNSNLQGDELKYLDVEKQGFTIFTVVKHFRLYLVKAQTKDIVPHHIVRYIFVYKEMGEI